MAVKGKFLKRPSALTLYRQKAAGASTTTTALAAKGATTVNLTSATGVTAGKSFQFGTDEDMERVEILSIASLVATLAKPLLKDHVSGDVFVEQSAYAIAGFKGGIKVSHAKQTSDETSGMQRLIFGTLDGYQTFGVEVQIEGFTIPNLCIALGIPFARIFGSGASISAPFNLATDFNDSDSEQNVCLVATYTLQDNTITVEEFWGCAADFSGLSVPMAFGQSGAVSVKFIVYSGAKQSDAAVPSVATALATYRAGKAKLFGKLTGFGIYTQAFTPTTVSTLALANATTLLVTDASNIVAESWIVLGSDDTVETHWVLSKASNTLTLKTSLLRDQAVGVVVTPATQTPFASITKDGVAFDVAGQSEPIQVGTRDLAVGSQAGTVQASLTAHIQSLTLSQRAYLLGIPQSAIANSQLLLTEQLNTATILAAYVQGTLKDGTVNILNLWGIAQDLSDMGAEMGTGANTSRQIKFKPVSGLQFVQY
jgi:hypothetical protein